MDSQKRAVDIIDHYFRQCWPEGCELPEDMRDEITQAVEGIVEAAVERVLGGKPEVKLAVPVTG